MTIVASVATFKSHFTVAPEVITHKTSPLSLYHFQFVNVRFCMRVPDGGAIFNLGSDKAFVAELFDGHSTVTQIFLQERECFMATSSYVVGVVVPRSSVVDGDP